jgi:tRNAThr (cytosine32-N3)-methyltransferase
MKENATVEFHCMDFSAAAVRLLGEEAARHEGFSDRIKTLFVGDVSQPQMILEQVPEHGCDLALLVFVMSAMGPERWDQVVESAYRVLRPGGMVLFRDYAEGDAAQKRYEKTPDSRVLGDGGCCRGDGTQAYFFQVSQLEEVWKKGGFRVQRCQVKEVAAQAEGGLMRKFIQAEFVRETK